MSGEAINAINEYSYKKPIEPVKQVESGAENNASSSPIKKKNPYSEPIWKAYLNKDLGNINTLTKWASSPAMYGLTSEETRMIEKLEEAYKAKEAGKITETQAVINESPVIAQAVVTKSNPESVKPAKSETTVFDDKNKKAASKAYSAASAFNVNETPLLAVVDPAKLTGGIFNEEKRLMTGVWTPSVFNSDALKDKKVVLGPTVENAEKMSKEVTVKKADPVKSITFESLYEKYGILPSFDEIINDEILKKEGKTAKPKNFVELYSETEKPKYGPLISKTDAKVTNPVKTDSKDLLKLFGIKTLFEQYGIAPTASEIIEGKEFKPEPFKAEETKKPEYDPLVSKIDKQTAKEALINRISSSVYDQAEKTFEAIAPYFPKKYLPLVKSGIERYYQILDDMAEAKEDEAVALRKQEKAQGEVEEATKKAEVANYQAKTAMTEYEKKQAQAKEEIAKIMANVSDAKDFKYTKKDLSAAEKKKDFAISKKAEANDLYRDAKFKENMAEFDMNMAEREMALVEAKMSALMAVAGAVLMKMGHSRMASA